MVIVKDYLEIDDDQAYTLVKSKPDKKSAFDRLDALEEAFATIEQVVNGTDISNTEKAWHESYSALTKAFMVCIKSEREIIG